MSKSTIDELERQLLQRDRELEKYRTEVAKLNQQLRELIEQIQHEVKMASSIQKTLVPTELPNIPGFEFSSKFVASMIAGGDYFDMFEHDDKFRFGIVLSSSSGYGMSALFLTVLMKLSNQMEAKKAGGPVEALRSITKEIQPSMHETDNADLFYAVVDRRTFEMNYVSAGNVIALHWNHEKHNVTRFDPKCGRLTKSSQNDYQSQTVPLNPKDRVVLVSRGISELRNNKDQVFDQKIISNILLEKSSDSVHDIRNEIMFSVERWAGTSEPQRDWTVIVIEVKDRILKLARN